MPLKNFFVWMKRIINLFHLTSGCISNRFSPSLLYAGLKAQAASNPTGHLTFWEPLDSMIHTSKLNQIGQSIDFGAPRSVRWDVWLRIISLCQRMNCSAASSPACLIPSLHLTAASAPAPFVFGALFFFSLSLFLSIFFGTFQKR